MKKPIYMRDLISHDELNALMASQSDSYPDESGRLRPESDSSTGTQTLTDESGAQTRTPESVGQGIRKLENNGDIVHNFAVSLYASLSINEILSQYQKALTRCDMPTEFLTMVQPRANQSVATVYSLDKNGKPHATYPHVIELLPTALSECLVTKKEIVKNIARIEDLDELEKNHLVPGHDGIGDTTVLYWPVVSSDELRGVLVLGLSGKQELTAGQSEFLESMNRHLSIAIKNSDAKYAEHRRGRQLHMLNEVACETSDEGSFKSCLLRICESVRKSFNYSSVQIWIRTGNRMEIAGHKSRYDLDEKNRNLAAAIVEECWDQNQIIMKNYSRAGFDMEWNGRGMSWFAIPMLLRSERIGVLFIESGQLDAFDSEDIGAIRSVASIIASRSYNVRVLKDYQRSEECLKAVLESADDWTLLFTDNQGYVLSCSVGVEKVFGVLQKEAVGKDVLSFFSENNIQRELLTFMRDENGPPRFRNYRVAQSGSKETSYLDVNFQRVSNSMGQQIGFVGAIQDISEKISQETQLKKLTHTDDLTNMNNPRGFLRTIKRNIGICKKSGCGLSLCFMDIDHLKTCNDTYGHLYGTRAIKEAAEILRQAIRPQDTCCRYGGDEFVIIMPQIDKFQAREYIEKLRAQISAHFEGKITASFGIADISGNVNTVEGLLKSADRALYQAKSLGRNQVALSDE